MKVIAAITLILGLIISLSNWIALFSSNENRHISPIPFLGGVFIALGLTGFDATRPYWWLAAFIDFGTFAFLLAIPAMLKELWEHSDRNIVHRFTTVDRDPTVILTLFKSGKASIQIISRRPAQAYDDPRYYTTYSSPALWTSTNGSFELFTDFNDDKITIARLNNHFAVIDVVGNNQICHGFDIHGVEFISDMSSMKEKGNDI